MNDKAEDKNVTRRDFIRTVGLAGITTALTGVPGAIGAPEPSGAVASASTVPRRTLGKTGVEVPILALGGTFNTKNNHLVLRQAMKWGVTYWDTAESYLNGMSEEGMGLFFARVPEARKKIFLTTKLHAEGANFTGRLDKSLKRLQTDHVDLLCIHSITGIEDMTSSIRAWATEMKKAGKIKFFGFSTHTNMEDCLLGAARLDWIDAIMFAYNFQNMNTPKMEEAVNACAKAGIGLVAIKSQAGTPEPKKAPGQALLEMIEKFFQRGFSDKQGKLKAVWENPHIASICSHMPNLTILSSNVFAARDMTKLSREEFESLRRYALERRAGYCAGCAKICQAAVEGAVPVNEVMRSLMYERYYGEPELARLTFAGLPDEVRERLAEVDYSKAEEVCPHKLAIGQLMRQASKLLA